VSVGNQSVVVSYGSSFVDKKGVRFEGHHPLERPDLWKVYLNEAEGIFRIED